MFDMNGRIGYWNHMRPAQKKTKPLFEKLPKQPSEPEKPPKIEGGGLVITKDASMKYCSE